MTLKYPLTYFTLVKFAKANGHRIFHAAALLKKTLTELCEDEDDIVFAFASDDGTAIGFFITTPSHASTICHHAYGESLEFEGEKPLMHDDEIFVTEVGQQTSAHNFSNPKTWLKYHQALQPA